jgi:hypothetical protein
MISGWYWRKHLALRVLYKSYAAYGMCSGCYRVALLRGSRDPVVRQSRLVPAGNPCRGCGRGMAPARVAYDLGLAKRGGYGMCIRCYVRARRRGTLPDPAPARGGLDEVELARLRAAVGLPGR